jgi:hypothetical protein
MGAGSHIIQPMLSGLQLAIHYPMMRMDTPANMNAIQALLIDVFTFEIIDGDVFKENLWKFKGKEVID